MIMAELFSNYSKRVWNWCLGHASDYVHFSTNKDGWEEVAAALQTVCGTAEMVCPSLNWKEEDKKVSKSICIQISSAEECNSMTKP